MTGRDEIKSAVKNSSSKGEEHRCGLVAGKLSNWLGLETPYQILSGLAEPG
jgi:hypothetical protein